MLSDLDEAKRLLHNGGYTCVLKLGNKVLTSTERGIAPLLKLIAAGKKLDGFCLADKIIGKAAALLCAYAGIKSLYADVISASALPILQTAGIAYEYATITDAIINRSGTDICPMEKTVLDIISPEDAYQALYKKINGRN